MTTPGEPPPGPYVPGPHGWVPAPPGWQPPTGWLPTPDGWVAAPPGWRPPPGWVATPSGWLPPPDYSPATHHYLHPVDPPLGQPPRRPNAAVRGFGWPRVLPARAQRAAALSDLKPPGREIWLVMLLFPAGAVVAAVASLAQTVSHVHQSGGYINTIVPHQPWLSAAIGLLAALTEFGPALLVIYLIGLSGGGLRAIGLDRSEVRTDIARCGKLIVLAYLVPFLIVGVLSALQGVENPAAASLKHLSIAYLIPLLTSSVGAGVVEEIVVLGYLVHRLEQRGWNGWSLVAVCTVVRVSYHLYYGFGAIGIAGWGALSVLLYRRRRRLLTFIVAHVLWDGTQFVTIYLHGGWQAFPELVVLPLVLLVLWGVGRGQVVGELFASQRTLDTDPQATGLPD